MTQVDYKKKLILVTCDCFDCEYLEGFLYDKIDYEEMTITARNVGWCIFKKNGTWHHLCPIHSKVDKTIL